MIDFRFCSRTHFVLWLGLFAGFVHCQPLNSSVSNIIDSSSPISDSNSTIVQPFDDKLYICPLTSNSTKVQICWLANDRGRQRLIDFSNNSTIRWLKKINPLSIECYLCSRINTSDKRDTSSIVSYSPKKRVNLIRFLDHRDHLVAIQSNNLIINCSHSSFVPGSIRWYKDGILIESQKSEYKRWNVNDFSLNIDRLRLNDKGNYTCVVSWKDGHTIRRSVDLEVDPAETAPVFKIQPPTVYENHIGDPLHLVCDFNYGFEHSNLIWMRWDCQVRRVCDQAMDIQFELLLSEFKRKEDQLGVWADQLIAGGEFKPFLNTSFVYGEPVMVNNDTNHENAYSFEIQHPNQSHSGIYACVARNNLGSALRLMQVRILEKPVEHHRLFEPKHFLPFMALLFVLAPLTLLGFKLRRPKEKIIEQERNYIIKNRVIIKYSTLGSDSGVDLRNGNQSNQLMSSSQMNRCLPIEPPQIELRKERVPLVRRDSSKKIEDDEELLFNYELPLDPGWEVSRDRLQLGDVLGEGAFGVVLKSLLLPESLPKNSSKIMPETPPADRDATSSCSGSMRTENSDRGSYYNFQTIIQHFNANSGQLQALSAFSNDYYGLASGQFGLIPSDQQQQPGHNYYNQGFLEENATIVAVKRLRDSYVDAELIDFVSEMEMMKRIGRHRNIINLIGTCTQAGPLYVIVEYAEHGNLRDYLKNYRSSRGCQQWDTKQATRLTQQHLISFAHQVSCGMQYLSSRHCIHRDLAARNVLVTSDLTLKIADFGLARNTGQSNYYRKVTDSRVPVKWMAPESLYHKVYTSQSDVWSFGILLYEITSLGGSPYHQLPVDQLLPFLQSGNRMPQPRWCSDSIYRLMLACWSWLPEQRPSFHGLTEQLAILFASQPPYQEFLNLNDEYIPTPPSSDDEDDQHIKSDPEQIPMSNLPSSATVNANTVTSTPPATPPALP